MGWSRLPKYAPVDPDSPSAWGSCDRCGFLWPLKDLQWQYEYRGSSIPQNTRILVCPHHLDPPNVQFAPYILPPDPPPIFNARPENYALDEDSWLATGTGLEGDALTTQDGKIITTNIPNPADRADASDVTTDVEQDD